MSSVDHASVLLQFGTLKASTFPLEKKLFAVEMEWFKSFEAQDAATNIDNTKLVKSKGKYIGELPVLRRKMVEGLDYKLVSPKQWHLLTLSYGGASHELPMKLDNRAF